jgi:Rrf2 family nitric oxide-sensitive transcriptional repressor|tara:strand:- start:1939 stop:2403 length:465 start_codon:yes stop_codon:yes gene_type:complete
MLDASFIEAAIMHFTVFTDYAFRVLIYLALNTERRATIHDIAEGYDVSKNHLMKVVNLLAKAGFVSANRGPNGGLELAMQADKIMVGEIVRLTEDNSKLVECMGSGNQCVITPACGLKSVLSEALQSFFKVLDKYSIKDLAKRGTTLKKLCGSA